MPSRTPRRPPPLPRCVKTVYRSMSFLLFPSLCCPPPPNANATRSRIKPPYHHKHKSRTGGRDAYQLYGSAIGDKTILHGEIALTVLARADEVASGAFHLHKFTGNSVATGVDLGPMGRVANKGGRDGVCCSVNSCIGVCSQKLNSTTTPPHPRVGGPVLPLLRREHRHHHLPHGLGQTRQEPPDHAQPRTSRSPLSSFPVSSPLNNPRNAYTTLLTPPLNTQDARRSLKELALQWDSEFDVHHTHHHST